MPIVKSIIRNSPRNVLCFLILLSIFVVAVLVLYFTHEIFTQDFRDPSSLFYLLFGMGTVIVLSSFIHPLLLFAFEDFLSGENSTLLYKLKKHLNAHEYLCYLTCLDILVGGLGLLLNWYMEVKFSWVSSLSFILVIIFASILFACMIVWFDYDDVDLSSSQNMEESIGASWAYGSYLAFYKKILKDITRRMSEFEKNHDIKLLVQKLVIICPLSCNANGSLSGKDGNLEYVGNLEEIIEDDGGNNNRTFKTNVYKICGPHESYIAAEIPSPLSTLYEMRDVMDNVILNYHRECFIKTLSNLLKSDQCTILEYDDLNSSEPLHSFLLSELEDKKFVNVILKPHF